MSTYPLSSSVARNAGALYVVQCVSFLVPIAEIPILARALGASLYGEILFCQALALSCSVVVEYGFNINAAQQVAVHREQPDALNRLFSQVLLAKVLLAAPIVVLCVLAWLSGLGGEHLRDPALVVFVIAYFLAFGFSPMWYFQGVERVTPPAMLDVALRLSGLGLLALWVRTPEDFYRALPILAIPPLLNTGLTLLWARCEAGPIHGTIQGAWRQIVEGFHFFVYRSASNLAMSAVPVFLGLSSGRRAVGEFAPPEKLIKGMISLALPFLTAVFPVFARELHLEGGQTSYRRPVTVIGVIGVLALLGAALGGWVGPWVLGALLGAGYPGSITIYYLLIGLVPLRILNQSMALVLLIPAGRARSTSYVISCLSVAAVLLGAWLAATHGGPGMAVGLLVGEVALFFVLLWMAIRLVRP